MDLSLAIEPGAQYKLQLFFVEACCNRAFDVVINGSVELEDFAPVIQQGGLDFAAMHGVVVTHEFTAASNTLAVLLDGTGITDESFPDHNPILSGFTLERLSPIVDSDEDGLPDEWEFRYFGNLDQGPEDDPDGDGLSNADELEQGTDPNNPDTDGDGLSDGDEIHVYGTDPLNRDTDGDGLLDGEEVNVHGTDPAKADTDDDGFNDFDELRLFTDPTDPEDFPRETTIGTFTGSAPGQGLDLSGNIVYAVDVGPNFPFSVIGDATFTDDAQPGITVVAGNNIGAWHNAINFGEEWEDLLLADIMKSIRWSASATATPQVVLTFSGLEVGAIYKLQLLFGEACCPRGFDVFIDGRHVINNFAPFHYQGGVGSNNTGVVVTHEVLSRGEQIVITLDGRGVTFPQYTDRNPILNAATLELVHPNVDSDNDGLPDPWEIKYFGNLDMGPNDDPDEDDLSNSEEFEAGTDPTNADTDGDGLTDGEEVNEYGTDPLNRDTDADGLSDGDEINVYGTDPLSSDTDGDGLPDGYEVNVTKSDPAKADSDGDGVNDYDEIVFMSDPMNANSVPRNIQVGRFSGGAVGKGLDLDGQIVYAVNFGPEEIDVGQIRDAFFTTETVPGVEVVSGNKAAGWFQSDYGFEWEDSLLAQIMSSISWSAGAGNPPNVTVTFSELEVGGAYKLQLLFAEQGWPRAFHIFINDTQVAKHFAPVHYQGGYVKDSGAVITYEMVAQSSDLTIVLDGRELGFLNYTDPNAIINGATLEYLGEGSLPPEIESIERSDSAISISVQSVPGRSYSLEYRADMNPTSPWQPAGSTVVADGTSLVLTDSEAEHLSGSEGYWRVRMD
jgi:hypothetical protein